MATRKNNKGKWIVFQLSPERNKTTNRNTSTQDCYGLVTCCFVGGYSQMNPKPNYMKKEQDIRPNLL
jgi:hypothetical protein